MISPLSLTRTFFWKVIWGIRGRHEDVVAARGGIGTSREELDITIQYAATRLDLGSEDTLLDIGCSVGFIIEKFAAIVGHVIAVDSSTTAVAQARELLRDRKNVEVLLADAAHVPMPPRSCSKILCFSVVHYFPSKAYWKDFLTEVKRLLAPGGMALVGDIPQKGKLDFDVASRYSFLKRLYMVPITIGVDRLIHQRYTPAEVIQTAAEAGLVARIVQQPKSLPFWDSRFDVLLSHE
jgi:ubiquinone/menaquinone biosynthesis C-methylase UbiE